MKRGYGSNNAILWEEVTDNKESGNSITQYNSFFMIFLFIDFFYFFFIRIFFLSSNYNIQNSIPIVGTTRPGHVLDDFHNLDRPLSGRLPGEEQGTSHRLFSNWALAAYMDRCRIFTA